MMSYRIKTGAITGFISSASGHVSWGCSGCHGTDHPTPSKTEVRVELYIYYYSGPA